MHDISPYNLDRTISISGELKEIADAEQLITEKLRQYEVCHFFQIRLYWRPKISIKNFNEFSVGYSINVTTKSLSWFKSKSNSNVSWFKS